MHISYERLIAIADAHYPGGLVRRYFEDPQGDHGDSLAKYIVDELESLAGMGNDDVGELREAAYRIDRAVVDLAAVSKGLGDEANRRVTARIKAQIRAHAKKSGKADAPAADPVNFKPGDYVRSTSGRAPRVGRLLYVTTTFGFAQDVCFVQLYCIEWADRTRSIEVPEYFDFPPLVAATKAQFTETRRRFDRLVAALQPGAKFVVHDGITEGLLVVLQAPMKGVLAHGAAWIGRSLFKMGDTSTADPPQTPSPPDHAFFVVAREINRNKLRAVRVEPGFIEVPPPALVAAPFRRGRDPHSMDGRGSAEAQETGPSTCSIAHS